MKANDIIVLTGPSAMSRFRLARLKKQIPAVEYCEYVHVVILNKALSKDDAEILESLLDYGPKNDLPKKRGKLAYVILPRAGTISPWSSKATDILHISGLTQVERVERGVRYYVGEEYNVGQLDPSFLFDRMTQDCFDVEDFSGLQEKLEPRSLQTVEVLGNGVSALSLANETMGLSLSEEELEYLRDAFVNLGRNPSDVELMMFAQANSEHCRHKIFNAEWTIDNKEQSESLFQMIRHTYNSINGANVLSAYSDNAAVISGPTGERLWVDPVSKQYVFRREPLHVLMKVETHNHPTAIAPFPGAATGSGGEIRDEGAVGRGSKPKAGLTGFSTSHLRIPGLEQPWEINTGKPDHIVSALEIMIEGPIGAASFNNEYGRPAITGYFRTLEIEDSLLDKGSVRGFHKPIMIAGGVGVVSQEHIFSQSFPNNTALVVIGGPGMLIGLGGGAASSRSSSDGSLDLDFASVQRGNAEIERRCQEVIDSCCALGADNPILLIHDVGAGGLSNALPELINDANAGGLINLRDIPSADESMSPMEIWSNESQERYVLGIAEDELRRFEEICNRERCPFSVVGRSTENGLLQVEDPLYENMAVDMPLNVLLSKPPKMIRKIVREVSAREGLVLPDVSIAEAIERVLQFPAVGSKKFLITIGDRSITGLVAKQPMVGRWQEPVADVAVTSSGFNTYEGEAFSMGEKSPVALISPAASARLAVAESLTNLISADIESLSRVVLSANWMAAAGSNAEDQALYDAVYAVGKEFCPALGIAIPVGKDSLSMKTHWRDGEQDRAVVSPLTLIASAFAPVSDVRKTVDPVLVDDSESVLLLIHLGLSRLGGSALAQVYGQIGNECPDVDEVKSFKQMLDFVLEIKKSGLILSMHDRSDGGVLVSILEMVFSSRIGVDVQISAGDAISYLFNEEVGFVIQVARKESEKIIKQCPVEATLIGRLRDDEQVRVFNDDQELFCSDRGVLQSQWAMTSYKMQSLRDEENCAREEHSLITMGKEDDPGLSCSVTFDVNEDICRPFIGGLERPKVAVLREQGVNGHIEMAAAFERAGFDCVDVHMTDLSESRRTLSEFDVLAACGGFSYGDVLGGGGGWAKSILFNSILRDQFLEFFESDKLALGVCNGCQMISQIKPILPDSQNLPRFVRNRSEQFESRTVMVKVNETKSPWLSGMEGSVLPVAVAHGEGKVEFDLSEQLNGLYDKNQVALQYVDSHHQVTERYPYNPNGAPKGIAGVLANEGKTLIMMPHPERVFRVCQNVFQDDGLEEDGPWLRLFRNARAQLG